MNLSSTDCGRIIPRSCRSHLAFGILIVLCITCFSPSVSAAPQTYFEDFTTTTYKDDQYTTADWDTTAGEVRLYPLPTIAGSCPTPGFAYSVATAGNYAFVADYSAGLQVIDISDPTSPVPAGSLDTPGIAQDIAITGDYVLRGCGAHGLQVRDICAPTNPTSAGSCDTPAPAN